MPTPARPRDDTRKPSLYRAANQIASALDDLSSGDLADLRRHPHDAPPPMAFWKVCVPHLDPLLPGAGEPRLHAERRWATAVSVMARLVGARPNLHRSKVPLGKALALADYSELRFHRLLEATEDLLPALVRRTAAFLVAKGQRANAVDLAMLVLVSQGDQADRIRHHIARDFFSVVLSQDSTSSNKD